MEKPSSRIEIVKQDIEKLIQAGKRDEAKNQLLAMLRQGRITDVVTILGNISHPYARQLLAQVEERYGVRHGGSPAASMGAVSASTTAKSRKPAKKSSRLTLILGAVVIVTVIAVAAVLLLNRANNPATAGSGQSSDGTVAISLPQAITLDTVNGSSLVMHLPADWSGVVNETSISIGNTAAAAGLLFNDLSPQNDQISGYLSVFIKDDTNPAALPSQTTARDQLNFMNTLFSSGPDKRLKNIRDLTVNGRPAVTASGTNVPGPDDLLIDAGFVIIDTGNSLLILSLSSAEGKLAEYEHELLAIAEGIQYDGVPASVPSQIVVNIPSPTEISTVAESISISSEDFANLGKNITHTFTNSQGQSYSLSIQIPDDWVSFPVETLPTLTITSDAQTLVRGASPLLTNQVLVDVTVLGNSAMNMTIEGLVASVGNVGEPTLISINNREALWVRNITTTDSRPGFENSQSAILVVETDKDYIVGLYLFTSLDTEITAYGSVLESMAATVEVSGPN